jgi:hypothetical protein
MIIFLTPTIPTSTWPLVRNSMAKVTMADPKQFDHEVPEICMHCGDTATVFKKRTFSRESDWVCILFIFGHLSHIIGSMVLTKRMRVETPFCDRHRNHWLGRQMTIYFTFVGLIAYMILAIVFANHVPHKVSEYLTVPFFLLGALGFLGWLVNIVILYSGTIRPTNITDDTITLTNVSPEFADAYREVWSDQTFDRGAFDRARVDLAEAVEKQWNRDSRKVDPQR